MIKKLALCILAATIALGCVSVAYAGETEKPEQNQNDGTYEFIGTSTYDLFTNYVDGYSIKVEKGLTVDMSNAGICAVLENENKRIEIYKQYIGSDAASYINYSNGFMKNTSDHTVEFNGYQQISSYNVHITSWHREKLSGDENDKNYYAVFDIVSGEYCYTFYIKGNKSIGELGGYMNLLESFTIQDAFRNAEFTKTNAVDPASRGWNEETAAFYEKYFGDEANLTWGLYEPQTNFEYGTGSYDYNQLKYYEQNFNYEFPIVLNYSQFENTTRHPNLDQRLSQAWAKGKVLELTLQTDWNSGGNVVYDILNGDYDLFLKNYAETIKNFGHPVLFRLCNEMNGDWCPYSGYNTSRDPEIYRELYQYVYGFFKEAEADNVIWIWNPNSVSFPNFKWNDASLYYPGDEYVDVIGLTAYNTGTYYATQGEKWRTFEDLYDGMVQQYSKRFGQPFMITEFASAGMGGDKPQWIREMFRKIETYDKIKVAVWWDGCDYDNGKIARNYTIDENQQVFETFRNFFRSAWNRDIFA